MYLTYWGWNSDPNGERGYIEGYLNGMGGSQWLNTVTQYYDTYEHIANPSGQLAGIWSDPSTPPAAPSQADIENEAQASANRFGLSPDATYLIALPTGHDFAGYVTSYCAYHGSTGEGTPRFIALPYVTDSVAGQSCSGSASGVTIALGHEIAETQSDPSGLGWYDNSQQEIGDKCPALNPSTHYQSVNFTTGTYVATQLFSNNAGDVCVIGAAAPPFVSSVSPESGTMNGGTTITIFGSNFQLGNTQVYFGGPPSVAATSVNVLSSTQLTAVTPAGATGQVGITVETPYGDSLKHNYQYVATGAYNAVTATRLMDTRTTSMPIPANGTRNLLVTGVDSVPSMGVTAVDLNVTVTDTSASGYLSVFPTGLDAPATSNLNCVAGTTVPNLVLTAVGSGGQITIYNESAAPVDVVVDLFGYFAPSASASPVGRYVPLTPSRLMDTRNGTGICLNPTAPSSSSCHSLAGGQTDELAVTNRGGVPLTGANSVELNVTVVNPTTAGYLTVYTTGTAQPTVSNLNFTAGETISNRVIVAPGGGYVSIYNYSGNVDVVVDVNGWYNDGSAATTPGYLFTPITGLRVCGSCANQGVGITNDGVVPNGAAAAALNITVTGASVPGYATIWPDGQSQPLASDINWAAQQTVANLAGGVALGADGAVRTFVNTPVTLILDLEGNFA